MTREPISRDTKVTLNLAIGIASIAVAAVLGQAVLTDKAVDKVYGTIEDIREVNVKMAVSVSRIGTQLEGVSGTVDRIESTSLREMSQLQKKITALEARIYELEKGS